MNNNKLNITLHRKIAVAFGALLLLVIIMWTFPNATVFLLVNLLGILLFAFLTLSILKA